MVYASPEDSSKVFLLEKVTDPIFFLVTCLFSVPF